MAVHLLRLLNEPAEWAVKAANDSQSHLAPRWPKSTRFALVAVVRSPGPRNEADTRAFWVTTEKEMDLLMTNHKYHVQWFTVAKNEIKDDMIEQTLTGSPFHE